MGTAESTLSRLQPVDEITTVTERSDDVDPIIERIKSLKIASPILKSEPPPAENSLTDILVRKPSSSSSISGTLNPKVLLELFSMYRDWQDEKAKKISQKQEEVENKIETVDALAVKLLQRFNFSVSAMSTTAQNLSDGCPIGPLEPFLQTQTQGILKQEISYLSESMKVHPLQVDVGELKGRLTMVISNCDALCKRIATEGPEELRSSVKLFVTSDMEPAHSTSVQRVLRSPSTRNQS